MRGHSGGWTTCERGFEGRSRAVHTVVERRARGAGNLLRASIEGVDLNYRLSGRPTLGLGGDHPGAMMSKIWLTYAWKDNEANDVDHVINELRRAGLEVGFDRKELLAGGRLWEQIDRAIADPSLDAWAIYTTKASLESEPCQEELAYALDRTLRTKGQKFKLIGIFPETMDRSVIPSALATRLYVQTTDPTWLQQIVDGIAGGRSEPDLSHVQPYGEKWHRIDGKDVLEVWPRTGRWLPFLFVVPAAEYGKIDKVWRNARDFPVLQGACQVGAAGDPADEWKGYAIQMPVTSTESAYVFFNDIPSEAYFGQEGHVQRAQFRRSPFFV